MDKRMMLAWLQGQAQKQELTTTKMQQKRLGINEQQEGVYPQFGKKRMPGRYEGDRNAIYTDDMGRLLGPSFQDHYVYNEKTTNTKLSASDTPISFPDVYKPKVFSGRNAYGGWWRERGAAPDPTTASLNPELIDRFADAKEKKTKELEDLASKYGDNSYFADKFATQIKNAYSGKGLLHQEPSIQISPELAGEQAAMRKFESRFRNKLRLNEQKKNSVDLLLEYVMKGTLTHDEHGKPLSAERAERRALRLGQILQIAMKSVMKGAGDSGKDDGREAHDRDESLAFTHNDQLERAIASLKAKGVIGVHDLDDIFDVSTRSHEKVWSDDHSPYEARIRAQGKFPEYPSPEWQTLEAHRGAHALQFASPQTPWDLRQNYGIQQPPRSVIKQDADEKQKSLSLKRRTDATNRTAELERERAEWNAGLERARKEEEKRERDKAYWWRITHGYGGGYGGSGSGGRVGMRTGM